MKRDFFLGSLLVVLVGAGCSGGGDGDDAPADAGVTVPPDEGGGGTGAPIVVVRSPNGGETFRGPAPIEVAWKVTDDGADVAYEVVALRGEEVLPISQGTIATGPGTLVWQPPEVGAPTAFRVRVTVHDGTHTITDDSDQDFMLAPDEQPISFAADIQPILSQRCAGSQCHDDDNPADGLRLTAGAAYAGLVDRATVQCPDRVYVAPGAPEESYLIFKLRGAGPCYYGDRMPRGTTPLTPAQIDLIAAWIAAGAPNN
jgi:hypothetical protein